MENWSRRHLKCIECDTTFSPHHAHGLCRKCFKKHQNRQARRRSNDKLLYGTENFDYIICQICGKPFQSLTTNGHLQIHNISEKEYKNKFPQARTKSLRVLSLVSESVSVSKQKKGKKYFSKPIKNEILINCTEEQIATSFVSFRQAGFPYDISNPEDYRKLKTCIMTKNNGAYTWIGQETRLATSFHPHFYECRRKGRLSPVDFFNNDQNLRHGIIKSFYLTGKATNSSLRSICRNESRSSHINNFPPRVALAVLKDLFPDKNDLYVLDPCAGFSGRQIGCAASGKIAEYCGIDISPHTHKGLLAAAEFLKGTGCRTIFDLHLGDCLAIMPSLKKGYNLCFTSPPFFDLEQYKDVPIETNYYNWIMNFLRPFVKSMFDCLLPGGKAAIYLESIDRKNIQDDFKQICKEQGFIEDEPIQFKCSRGVYQRNVEKFKRVGILVWTKP